MVFKKCYFVGNLVEKENNSFKIEFNIKYALYYCLLVGEFSFFFMLYLVLYRYVNVFFENLFVLFLF